MNAHTNQTFCIYCQKEYHETRKLIVHLRRVHMGTIAQVNLAPDKPTSSCNVASGDSA